MCIRDRLVDVAGVDPSATLRKDRRRPIHWAARNGRLETLRWLVETRGCDPGAKTYDGDQAFHLAVWRGHRACAEYLAETAKTDANGRNRWGCNALLWACIAQREVDDGKGKGGGGGGESCLATARWLVDCLLYTSPSPRDATLSRMPSSA